MLQIPRPAKSLFPFVFALFFCAPVFAETTWEDVDPGKALLDLENANRHFLQQRNDLKTTFEQSEWTLDDGSTMYFHVAWTKPRWTLVKGGPTLEELFHRIFPNAELVEIGEPFVNRERGTRGRAEWLRYRDGGSHCVIVRQYGWDDDSSSFGKVPLGNRVAIGYRCANAELDDAQIKALIERIDL